MLREMESATATNTITLRVALHADLRKYLRPGEVNPRRVELPSGARSNALIAVLGMQREESVTIGVNGELARPGQELRDGDEITLFSPMEGG